MELGAGGGGTGPDRTRGRILQRHRVPSLAAGLFKQMPGHQFCLARDHADTGGGQTDFAGIRKRLLAAVGTALAGYKEEIERQTLEIARTVISTPVVSMQPKVQLRFVAAGVEAVIRYPVDLKNAADIDEQVAHEVLKSLEQDPKVKLAGDTGAAIRLTTDPAGGAGT
jgi:hypothetical protein